MSLNHCIYNTPSQLTWSVKKRFTDSHLHSHPLSPMLSETLQFTFWHWSWDLNSSTSWKALWIAHMTACHINSQKQPSRFCNMVSIFFHSWVSTSQTVIHNRIVTISWIPLSTFWLAALISLFPLCLAPNLVLPHLLHPLLLPCFQSCRKPEHKIAQLFVIDERLIDTGQWTYRYVVIRQSNYSSDGTPGDLTNSPGLTPQQTRHSCNNCTYVNNHQCQHT